MSFSPQQQLEWEEYKRLCDRVHKRDGWRCRCPGCKSRENLHAHHIVFRSHGGLNVAENLITVCHDCHTAIHAYNLSIEFLPFTEWTSRTYGWQFHNGWSPQRRNS